jgi:hypothetical protein
LLFSAHYFTPNGSLTDESKEKASIYGDTWLVNGRIQPYLEVEPRKYRFRILNGAVSRTLNFTLENDSSPVEINVIGSDGGLRPSPASTKSLITGMGERWEIIVDFAQFASQTLTLRATNSWTDKEYAGMRDILQFRVGKTFLKQAGNAPLLQKFNIDVKFPTERIAATREFNFRSHMDMMWGINSYHMDSAMDRILMRPPLGTIERYVFRSDGMGSMSGGMGSMGAKGGGMGSMNSGNQGGSSSSSSMMGGADMSSPKGMNGMEMPMLGDMMDTTAKPSAENAMAGMAMASAVQESTLSLPIPISIPEMPVGMTMNSSTHSSHHGGGGGINMAMKRATRQKRQMQGMMGSKGGSMMGNNGNMNMGGQWTHIIHLHLVVSHPLATRITILAGLK